MKETLDIVRSNKTSKTSSRDLVRQWGREFPLLRSRDLQERGISRELIRVMVEEGELMLLSRGVYALKETPFSAHFSLAIAAKRVPDGVVCLLSALLFHDIGTQLPRSVWLGIGSKAHLPRLDYPSLRTVRFSELGLHEGVETHVLDGVEVRITSPARTLVDCFRYRNKVGLDVALEALKDCFRARLRSQDLKRGQVRAPRKLLVSYGEVEDLARQFRVANVMRPYLETIAAE